MLDLQERLAADVGGRYVIERELGRGGMATVYLARDLLDERRVAIKVLDPELAAAVGGVRFKREIEIAQKLQHPNILGIYESGEAAGSLYYVMPYVTGESLRDRLQREKQLPVEDAVRIAGEVADALDYAHQQGIVHRDIKPENVLLQDGHALVADFGIARAASLADNKTLTKTGVAMGTPQYMSPEQIFAEKDIDGRTDEYALACMLHEMLAGQPPFVAPTAQALMAQHALDEPPLVTRFRNATPVHVEDALLTALAKSRVDRFPTLGDFADAIRTPGKHTSAMRATRARPVPTPATQPALAPVPLWKRLVPIGAAMVLGLLAMFALFEFVVKPKLGRAASGLTADEKALMSKVAVLYFVPDGGAELAPLADGLTDALIDRLRQVQGLDVVSTNAVAPYRDRKVESDSIGRALHVGTVVEGRVSGDTGRVRVDFSLRDAQSGERIDGGTIAMAGGNLLAAQDSLAEQVAGALRKLLGEEVTLKEQRASTNNPQAWTVFQRAERARRNADSLLKAGAVGESERALRSADSLALRSAAMDPKWAAPHVLRSRIAYARVQRLERDPQGAAPWLDSTIVRAERALAVDPRSPEALEMRGTGRFMRIRYGLVPRKGEADKLLAAAEADLTAAVTYEPKLASALNTLSIVQYSKLDLPASQNFAQKAYEADAYLTAAPSIVWRLYVTSYDQASAPGAQKWCAEGAARFPADARFVSCQLWLMTMKGVDPDPAKAWRLLDEMKQRTPPQDWEYKRRETEVVVAAALARAGLADSARHVLLRARAGPDIDPRGEIMGYEAFVRTLLGDRDEAVALIERYLTAHPEHRAGFRHANAWWWGSLQGDPRFQRVMALGS